MLRPAALRHPRRGGNAGQLHRQVRQGRPPQRQTADPPVPRGVKSQWGSRAFSPILRQAALRDPLPRRGRCRNVIPEPTGTDDDFGGFGTKSRAPSHPPVLLDPVQEQLRLLPAVLAFMPFRTIPHALQPGQEGKRLTAPAAMAARIFPARFRFSGRSVPRRRILKRRSDAKALAEAEGVGVLGAAEPAMTAEHVAGELAQAPCAASWSVFRHGYPILRRFSARRLARISGKIQGGIQARHLPEAVPG